MAFAAGDSVHVRAIGKGVVREVRNGGRYLVDVGGRAVVTTEDQLTAQEVRAKPKKKNDGLKPVATQDSESIASIDLHGMTVDEALEALIAFLNSAMLRGVAELHVIHGRSGGRLKAAAHQQLARMPSVRSFALDGRNPGVTIVKL